MDGSVSDFRPEVPIEADFSELRPKSHVFEKYLFEETDPHQLCCDTVMSAPSSFHFMLYDAALRQCADKLQLSRAQSTAFRNTQIHVI